VIGAQDSTDVPTTFEQDHHAVPAHIGKATDDAVLAPNHDDRLVDDCVGQVVAGIRNLRGDTDSEPVTFEDPLLLERKDLRRVVQCGWRGSSSCQRFAGFRCKRRENSHCASRRRKHPTLFLKLHSIEVYSAAVCYRFLRFILPPSLAWTYRGHLLARSLPASEWLCSKIRLT